MILFLIIKIISTAFFLLSKCSYWKFKVTYMASTCGLHCISVGQHSCIVMTVIKASISEQQAGAHSL